MQRLVNHGLSCLLLACAVGLSACGGNAPKSVDVTPAAPPAAKAILNEMAETGSVGSAAESIRESLTSMRETDAAKADALLKELDELEAMSNPAQIKSKAKAMADKL